MPYRDPHKKAESDKAYRAKNADSLRARSKAWRQANLEKRREHAAKWNAANPDYYKLRKYGIGSEDLKLLREQQRGLCAICEQTGELVIDHDHVTGKVRGLLCHACNKGLGMFADTPDCLVSAATYLRAKKD